MTTDELKEYLKAVVDMERIVYLQKQIEQQIGYAAPADTSDHFDQAVVFLWNQFVQVDIPADLHMITSVCFTKMQHDAFLLIILYLKVRKNQRFI